MQNAPRCAGDPAFHVLHILQTQNQSCACPTQTGPMTGPGAGHAGPSMRSAREFPVEQVLVLLLYVSLLSDILNIIRGRYHNRRDEPVQESSRPFRPLVSSLRKSCSMCQEKKSVRSLDVLWRRMRQATNQMRLINLRHHVITKVMMESRMEARMHEREKMQKKKEKLFGDILQSIRPTMHRFSNRRS